MIQTWNNFLTGINVSYNITPRQQIQLQMLNSLTGTTEEMYGKFERAKMPMVYTLNWNGNFNDVFKTRWSASFMNETRGEHLYFFAIGNEFKITEKFGGYVDWMYSREGVDRHGVMTNIVQGSEHERNTTKTDYMSVVLRLNYRFLPAWNLVAKATLDTAGIYADSRRHQQGKLLHNLGICRGRGVLSFQGPQPPFLRSLHGPDPQLHIQGKGVRKHRLFHQQSFCRIHLGHAGVLKSGRATPAISLSNRRWLLSDL